MFMGKMALLLPFKSSLRRKGRLKAIKKIKKRPIEIRLFKFKIITTREDTVKKAKINNAGITVVS
jgi:hypothetical protein